MSVSNLPGSSGGPSGSPAQKVIIVGEESGESLPVGVLTASAPTSASVGVASAQALAANTSRTGLIMVNTSANRISLGLGATAVLDSGISLAASGGAWTMGREDFTTAAINAIASAAASNLAIQEFT